jgi:WD40 repeat protein
MNDPAFPPAPVTRRQPAAVSWLFAGLLLALPASAEEKAILTLSHEGGVHAIAFSSDGKLVLTGSDDRTAQLWDVTTGKQVGPSWRSGGQVQAVAFSPDGRVILTGSFDRRASLGRVPEATR